MQRSAREFTWYEFASLESVYRSIRGLWLVGNSIRLRLTSAL